jgi:hypothetical protein
MKIIPVIKDEHGIVLGSSEPFPPITKLVTFDGENFIVYEGTDILPE